jgi:hypothetical protein
MLIIFWLFVSNSNKITKICARVTRDPVSGFRVGIALSFAINSYYRGHNHFEFSYACFWLTFKPKNPLGHRWPGFGPSGEYFILVFGKLILLGTNTKNYVLQNLSSEHIILKFCYKIVRCFCWIKNAIFYEIPVTHSHCISIHSACHWKSLRVPRLAHVP